MGARFLLLSDLHLGSRHPHLGAGDESRSREVLETFRRAILVALAPESRVDAVLIAGNLFEAHDVGPEVRAFARGLFGRLAAAGKPVFLVAGARDSLDYRDGVLRAERWPGVELLASPGPGAPASTTLAGIPVHVYGASPAARRSPRAFPGFSRVPEPGIHIGLLNAVPPEHEEAQFRPHDMTVDEAAIAASEMDLFVLGGLHGRHEVRAGRTLAVWPGTLEGRRFEPGDLGPRELLIAEVEDSGEAAIEARPLQTRVLLDFEIDANREGIRDASDLVAALASRGGSGILARATLRGHLEFLADMPSVIERAAREFHHLEVVDATTLLGSRLLERLRTENTIRGSFARRMSDRIAIAREREARGRARDAREVRVLERALQIGLAEFVELEPAAPPDLGSPPRSRREEGLAPRTAPAQSIAAGQASSEEGLP
jgi:exonuclease SbcD